MGRAARSAHLLRVGHKKLLRDPIIKL